MKTLLEKAGYYKKTPPTLARLISSTPPAPKCDTGGVPPMTVIHGTGCAGIVPGIGEYMECADLSALCRCLRPTRENSRDPKLRQSEFDEKPRVVLPRQSEHSKNSGTTVTPVINPFLIVTPAFITGYVL